MSEQVTYTCGVCGMSHTDTEDNLMEAWTPTIWIMDGSTYGKTVDIVCPVCSQACDWGGVEDDEPSMQKELFDRLKDSYKEPEAEPLNYAQKELKTVLDTQGDEYKPTLQVKGSVEKSNCVDISKAQLAKIIEILAD